MTMIYDGTLFVSYGFVWLSTHDGHDLPELMSVRGGQVNGLLGAAEPGALSMLTATHTGHIRLRIETHAAAPAVGDEWDDVVEASFEPRGTSAWLSTFDDGAAVELPAHSSYRARLCCAGWDTANEPVNDPVDDEALDAPSVDHYLLQLWPAPPGPDAVVRQRSSGTQYWHDVARTTAPPAPLTDRAQTILNDEERATHGAERSELDWRQTMLRQQWGGTAPDERLLALGGYAQQLAHRSRSLVDLIAAADPATQRALATWAAHRVCAAASDRLDWAAGLAAVEAGLPLPPPFDDADTVYTLAWGAGDASEPTEMLIVASAGPNVRRLIDPTVGAREALAGLTHPDPLRAALDCVTAASWSEHDESAYLKQVRNRTEEHGPGLTHL